jgi:hypothetical protein
LASFSKIATMTLYVDELYDNHIGITNTPVNIAYNLNQLGDDISINAEIRRTLSSGGVMAVIPLGRYITVIALKKDSDEGVMTFMDHDINMPPDELRKTLHLMFPEGIVERWITMHKMWKMLYEESDNNVRLVKKTIQ